MIQKVAFVFPGQGSQGVGMGRAWAADSSQARRAFEQADEILGFSLSELCWQGPEDELQLTINTQPALLATSVAIWRVLREAGIEPTVVAGHSLGEYSALVAAGSLDFGAALQLVRRRGEAMQRAVPVGEGAMAAILGLEVDEIRRAAAESADAGVCVVANYNAPGQIVIAGHTAAVEQTVDACKARGARRAILLPVSAPFHSPLMAPARKALTPYLEQSSFNAPAIPVITNVDATPVTTGSAARDALRRQVDGPVRWIESVEWMATECGVELFVEVGPGKVLAGLNRRIAPQIKTLSLGEPAALETLRERLDG